jgi:hypothetical protein
MSGVPSRFKRQNPRHIRTTGSVGQRMRSLLGHHLFGIFLNLAKLWHFAFTPANSKAIFTWS